ncbi:cation-translocating P-type ATPase [Eubacteriales bacterium OttesenSCG-928-K08]|nr:cation-translocating P-type ATPase [Eubacteriales bacterium OttesenSCG-928-K08]
MNHYLETKEAVFENAQSTPEGLSSTTAAQRLERDGRNKLDEGEKVSLFRRFLNQMADPMIIILIVAAAISGVTSVYAGESFADVFIILAVVLINATLGMVQESKAEQAIEALMEMSAATSKVLRDGKLISVKSDELVVGDVVILEAGDAVPADCRITECFSMKVEEAALTGESVPVNKQTEPVAPAENGDVPLGDRANMLYMGSVVVYGRGRAVVVATGMNTEMGKIASAIMLAEDGRTPLQKKLAQLSKILTVLVLGICVLIFGFSVIRAGDITGELVLNSFMIAVSLAVAAIPEGLVAVVTIVLSIGVTKMSKQNAVIRKLTAVETLGCTQVICSDKTGTLTQNKMTVVDHFGDDERLLATGMALCCDAQLDQDTNSATGEPTECALVNYANALGLKKDACENVTPRVGEAPFDSGRKMMSTVHKTNDGFVQYTKGAPDELLKLCTGFYRNGEVVPMTESLLQEILKANSAMAEKALRVLALAKKDYAQMPASIEAKDLEQELVFVGLTGMIDPVRPEVYAAIEECRLAGIRPIMITGDHKDTATAIARELKIIDEKSEAITGAQLNTMSDEELEKNIEKYSVYARVQPEHKVRIVNAWRANGKVTAMTGDGVNDAPSIKSADIGVGMGITGTDVTKNVADMVLADDNFATIVSAVGEGRRIYDNIRKAIQFLLASNLSEVLSIFAATVMGFTILHPVHILWINLITDAFPALALGMESAEPDLMQRKPRPSTDGIFSGGVGVDVAYQGFMVTCLTLAAYFIGHFMEAGVWEIANSDDGITMAFLTMSMAEIFHSFNMRSQRGSIFRLKKQNWYLWGAMALSLLLTTTVIYVPALSNLFEFTHINIVEYFTAMALAVSVIPITEVVKLIQRLVAKAKK